MHAVHSEISTVNQERLPAGACLSSDLRIIFGFNERKKTIARTQKKRMFLNFRLVDIVFIGSHVTSGTAQVVFSLLILRQNWSELNSASDVPERLKFVHLS